MSAPFASNKPRHASSGVAVTTLRAGTSPDQWRRPQRPCFLPGQLGEHAYGVICAATTPLRIPLRGEVAALECCLPGLAACASPPDLRHLLASGYVTTLPHTWRQAWHGSRNRTINLPSSRISERHGARLTPPPAAAVEIWLAVMPKQALA